VTTTCRDRLTGKEITIRSKYLIGADGGNSKVAELEKLPFEGQMGVGGSMNIIFKADLSKYVAHRPSVLYWVVQPGADVGGIGMGLVRMVRPWNEWLIVWGYDINSPHRRWTRPLPPRWCAIWSATSLWSRRSPRPRPGRSTTCTPPTCSRAASSSWATRPTGIRHRTGLAPTPRSRMASTSPGKLAAVLKGSGRRRAAGQLQPGTRAGGQADRHPRQPVDRRVRPDLRGARADGVAPIRK
jgi:hypothetical protein